MRSTVLLLAAILATATYGQFDGRMPPIPEVKPEAVYPAEVLAAHRPGKVLVWVRIGPDGRVFDAFAFGPYKTCSGEFDNFADKVQAAALYAAKRSIFKPYTREGVPSGSSLVLTYELPKPPETQEPKPKAPDTSDAAKTSSPVVNGRAIALPKPTYPPLARALHLNGPASVQISIDEQGNVLTAGAGSGHPLLLAASADAACQAKFSPTILSGEAVKVVGVITYNFVP